MKLISSIIWFYVAGALAAPIAGVHTPLREVHCGGQTYREFTLGEAVDPAKPLLRDVFEGRATLSPLNDQPVTVRFTSAGVTSWDVKLPIFRAPGHDALYSFARGYKSDQHFDIYLVQSTDGGRTFVETAGETPGATNGSLTRYNNDPQIYDNQIDPALSIDYSTCPPTYRLAAECSHVPTGHVEVCESHSQTPLNLASWSRVIPLVNGDNRFHSGSTGVLLMDDVPARDGGWRTDRYVKWSDVQNTDHRVTTVIARDDALTRLGQSGVVGLTVLEAQVFPCLGWDCNNRDAQDWKREGDQYFMSYNGANYYGCEDTGAKPNVWGLSFARAQGSPLAPYTLLSAPLMIAPRRDICGISYPYVNVIEGEIYIYYAFYEAGGPAPGTNRLARSRLLFKR